MQLLCSTGTFSRSSDATSYFGRFLRQLREIGFDGALSLEARAIDSEGRVDVASIQASLHLIAQLAG